LPNLMGQPAAAFGADAIAARPTGFRAPHAARTLTLTAVRAAAPALFFTSTHRLISFQPDACPGSWLRKNSHAPRSRPQPALGRERPRQRTGNLPSADRPRYI